MSELSLSIASPDDEVVELLDITVPTAFLGSLNNGSSPGSLDKLDKSTISQKSIVWKVVYCSVTFCVLFTGFNVSQGFVTSILPEDQGYWVLMSLYLTFGLSAAFVPTFIIWLETIFGPGRTEKYTMFISSWAFTAFCFSLVFRIEWLIFVCAVLNGVGAALLWVSEGLWLTRIIKGSGNQSSAIIGTVTGTFFAIFNINSIIGNVLSILILQFEVSFEVMLVVMACVCGFGSWMFLGVSDVPVVHDGVDTMDAGAKYRAATAELPGLLRAFVKKPFTRLLTPFLIYQGMFIAYISANLPDIINYASSKAASDNFEVDKNFLALNVVYVFLLFGIGSVVGAYVWGKLYDKCHSRITPLLFWNVVMQFTAMGVIVAVVNAPISYPLSIQPCMFIVGFILGAAMSVMNAIVNNSCSKYFTGQDTKIAFSWFRFVYGIGYAISIVVSTSFPAVKEFDEINGGIRRYGWLFQIALQLVATVISAACALRLEYSPVINLKSKS